MLRIVLWTEWDKYSRLLRTWLCIRGRHQRRRLVYGMYTMQLYWTMHHLTDRQPTQQSVVIAACTPLPSHSCFRSVGSRLIPGPVVSTHHPIAFGSLNVHSAIGKMELIHQTIVDNNLDVLAICEMWIYDDTPTMIKTDLAPPGFCVHHVYHQASSGHTWRRSSHRSCERADSALTVASWHFLGSHSRSN